MIGSVHEITYPGGQTRHYGFIYVDGGSQYFFHRNDLTNCTMYQLEEGDVVEFNATINEGRLKAVNVRKVYQTTPQSNVVNPGINPMVTIDHFNNDEQRIVNILGKVFYVTYGGKEFTINDSVYRYCLIKPTEYFVQTFQLSRELVVIFTDYVSFEPRSLDAANYVYQHTSKLRLDKGCHILVCHDEAIESKLARLLKDSNVNQIVVPFTYKELMRENVDSNLIRERFRKYLFDTDLFATSQPIQNDIFFFGRRDLVHDIVSKCKSNINCGVFGLRRSGKTSVLYAVEKLLHQQSYFTVFVPCESDLSSLDWRAALYKLVYNITLALGKNPSKLDAKSYQSFDTVMYFEEDMNNLLKDVPLPITIMFDEIEAITFSVLQGEDSDNLWVDGDSFVYFWSTLKGYYSKYPKRISILVAGTNPMINEVPMIGKKKQANPMFRQLSESNQGAYLQAFTQEDTNNMVNALGGYMGLHFDEYCIGRLTSDCGGHPYLMRILCSYINRFIRTNNLQRPITVTKAIYDHALPAFESSSEAISFFWMILNILVTSYPKEFETLKVLALQGDELISQIQDPAALLHLIGYGLIECNQKHYAIKYNVITRFLQGEYQFERTGLSIEEQKAEIQLRINSAEMQLRKLVKNTLRTVKGETNAKAIVLSAMANLPAISSQDIYKAKNLSYSQLFDASVNKIYFSLLMKIINENTSLFENIFEGNSPDNIHNHLQVINTARRCPDHSYTENSMNWSWSKFVEFRNSISWLENILKNFE